MSFDPANAAQQVASQFYPRLEALGMGQEELQQDANILGQFCNIAVGMLVQEPFIEMPGSDQPIQLEEPHIMQGLTLFAEGIYLAMVKCLEMSIPPEIKGQLLQQLALDVFNQAKQVVASTYGQEHTPEFQFTFDQQVQLINQGAESALMYYINEYEKENGPIHVEETPSRLLPKVEKAMVEDGVPLPGADLPPMPTPVAAPPKPKGPTPHDKYGAVALLLTTLAADQRARILQNFNAEEKELIGFYSYPQHIEQNLDISCVQEHLKRFKELLKQGGPGLKSAAHRGISRLAKSNPMEKLLSYVKDERPVVKQYIQSHYADEAAHPLLEGLPAAGSQNPHFSDLLPSRVEEILYKYLARRVEAHG